MTAYFEQTEDASIIRMLERGEITESDIHFSIDEEFTIPPDASPDEVASLMARAQYRSERIMKLKMARLRLLILSKVSHNSSMDFERYYRDLYEDIKAHHDVWFDDLFNDLAAHHVDKSAVILGTLCTILRQRGDLDGCMEVMPTYMAVLKKYQRLAKMCKVRGEIENYEMLAYKASLIRINCGSQLGDKKMAVQAFRDVVAYEKKQKALGRFDDDDDNIADYDAVAQVVIGHSRYSQVSDDVIFKCVGVLTGNDSSITRPELELRECGCCDKKEVMLGDFKKCSRCHEQSYCTKECQVKDWKVHKLLCGKKNTTNIESSALLGVAKLLLKNHTATVELRTGQPVNESHKANAMAGLVKRLKQLFTGEFKQYNDMSNAADAGSDPEFTAALADFFAEQPGYKEVWSALRVGYKEKLIQKQQTNLQHGILNISDDFIREKCEELARGFKYHCGSAYAESGDTEDLLDTTRHNAMVDGIMNLAKKFVIENPQYNSFAGFFEMLEDNDFKIKMGVVVALCYDERGPQTDTIVDVISGTV